MRGDKFEDNGCSMIFVYVFDNDLKYVVMSLVFIVGIVFSKHVDIFIVGNDFGNVIR